MTDTTDTAVLRDKKYVTPEWARNLLADPGILGPAMIELLHVYLQQVDQLEAEHQRCAEITEQYVDRTTALSFATQRAEAAEKEREGLQKALVIYGDEILELRAKLANPVVLSDCSFEAVSHMAHWYSEGECVAWVSGAEHVKKKILEDGFTVKGE